MTQFVVSESDFRTRTVSGDLLEINYGTCSGEVWQTDGSKWLIRFEPEQTAEIDQNRCQSVVVTGTIESTDALHAGTIRVSMIAGARSSFWDPVSVERLVREQGTSGRFDPRELAGGWPEEEDLDDFLATWRRWRAEE